MKDTAVNDANDFPNSASTPGFTESRSACSSAPEGKRKVSIDFRGLVNYFVNHDSPAGAAAPNPPGIPDDI